MKWGIFVIFLKKFLFYSPVLLGLQLCICWTFNISSQIPDTLFFQSLSLLLPPSLVLLDYLVNLLKTHCHLHSVLNPYHEVLNISDIEFFSCRIYLVLFLFSICLYRFPITSFTKSLFSFTLLSTVIIAALQCLSDNSNFEVISGLDLGLSFPLAMDHIFLIFLCVDFGLYPGHWKCYAVKFLEFVIFFHRMLQAIIWLDSNYKLCIANSGQHLMSQLKAGLRCVCVCRFQNLLTELESFLVLSFPGFSLPFPVALFALGSVLWFFRPEKPCYLLDFYLSCMCYNCSLLSA